MARHRIVTRGGRRRETSWLDVELASNVVNTSGTLISHVMVAAELAKRPFTVIRSILEVLITSDQLGADEFQMSAIGMCVVSSQAVAIGVTAVPTPLTDQGSDLWFLHQNLLNDFLFISGVGVDGSAGRRYGLDSRAARKVNDDQEIIVVLETGGISSGANIIVSGRVLIKEH